MMNESDSALNTTNSTSFVPLDYVSFLNIVVFIEATTSVLILVGNGFVIALIQRRKLLGRSTNIFVFSIATADFLNGIISIPAHILFLTIDGESSVYLCKCYKFVLYITKTVVPYTIVFMTAEKTMRILCPTKEIVTVARCMFFTSLWWFFSASFNIWCVVLFSKEPKSVFDKVGESIHYYKVPSCSLTPRFSYLHNVFLITDLLVIFVTPASIILSIYIVLIRNYFTVLRERILTYFYVIKLFLALFATFVICQLPLEIITFLDNQQELPSFIYSLVSHFATSLYYTRGIWNLVIYGYFKHYVCRKRNFASIRASNGYALNKTNLGVPSFRGRFIRQRDRRM